MLILILLSAILGALIGSFLNVVIARVPAGVSVVRPASHCPHCRVPIQARDNVPVISWLVLRGRGRCCGQPISWRYPTVELATALAFAAITSWFAARADDIDWVLRGQGLVSLPGVLAWLTLLYLGAVSIALTMIDIDVKRLPAMMVLQAWAVVGVGLIAAAALAGNHGAVLRTFGGAAVVWCLYRVVHQLYPGGMGYGDVRLAALVGGATGWIGWSAVAVGTFAGFFLGAVGGIALMTFSSAGRKAQVPYGPYMLAGMWVAMVLGPGLWQRYLDLVTF